MTFTGERATKVACKHGHVAPRYSNGGCSVCVKRNTRAWRARNREKIKKPSKEKSREYNARYKAKMGDAYATYQREWKRKNADTGSIQRRIRTYGLKSNELGQRFCEQGGECAICHAEMTLLGHGGAHVDHDHDTNEVRGLLCRACNTGLGQFDDSSDRLRVAIAYLERKKQ